MYFHKSVAKSNDYYSLCIFYCFDQKMVIAINTYTTFLKSVIDIFARRGINKKHGQFKGRSLSFNHPMFSIGAKCEYGARY